MYDGIIFNQISSDHILNTSLYILKSNETSELDIGLDREEIKGDTTASRPIANDYATKYSSTIQFGILLVKSDCSDMTVTEQRKIAKWLTSPNTYKKLEFIKDGKTAAFYVMAKCLSYRPFIVNGVNGINVTFTCDSPFMYQDVTQTYTVKDGDIITFENNSDCEDDYSYPIWELNSEIKQNILLTLMNNYTNESVTFLLKQNDRLEIDSNACTVRLASELVPIHKIGWESPEDICFPKLINGENQISITIKPANKLSISLTPDDVDYYNLTSNDGISIIGNCKINDGVLSLPGGTTGTNYAVLDADLTDITATPTTGVTIGFFVKASSQKDTYSPPDGFSPLVSFTWVDDGFMSVLASLEIGGNVAGTWIDPTWDADGDTSTENDNIVLRVSKDAYDYITLTVDTSAVKVYKNGVLYSTDTTFGGGSPSTLLGLIKNGLCKIRIGGWTCSWWKFHDFAGSYKNISVIQKALTANEVLDLYNHNGIIDTGDITGNTTITISNKEYIKGVVYEQMQ